MNGFKSLVDQVLEAKFPSTKKKTTKPALDIQSMDLDDLHVFYGEEATPPGANAGFGWSDGEDIENDIELYRLVEHLAKHSKPSERQDPDLWDLHPNGSGEGIVEFQGMKLGLSPGPNICGKRSDLERLAELAHSLPPLPDEDEIRDSHED